MLLDKKTYGAVRKNGRQAEKSQVLWLERKPYSLHRDKTCTTTVEGMAPPQKILFSPEKIFMDWQQRQRAGAGLYNLGNMCFLNSILQCLTYTPPLANYLLSREHSQSCHQQGFCMMCRMEAHVNKVLHSSDSAIQPWDVLSVLSRIGVHFELGVLADALEFLCCTVSAMQTACLSGRSK
ncbi:ubiquitin carboxyl-terminal hydrolase 42-like [Tyto alba]|uniref:ubiquitin carboxyl-terminal hydrolase 42-like n=1 Tax=Tyto alba TaxID=56313 RepID=UPI001C672506|nr:ubiquitin carboxyl-terminal hydrolase 42-like [Tyto alba]